jgi:mRNA interferase RelE/StbE
LASQPKKFLKKLSKQNLNRILKKLTELSENPLPRETRMVEGQKEKTYRIRVGDIRILYTVFWKEKLIIISIIDWRSRAYR